MSSMISSAGLEIGVSISLPLSLVCAPKCSANGPLRTPTTQRRAGALLRARRQCLVPRQHGDDRDRFHRFEPAINIHQSLLQPGKPHGARCHVVWLRLLA